MYLLNNSVLYIYGKIRFGEIKRDHRNGLFLFRNNTLLCVNYKSNEDISIKKAILSGGHSLISTLEITFLIVLYLHHSKY